MDRPTATALIVAAGRGTRAGGGLPKQWRDLAGQPVVARSVAAFAGAVDAVIVVIHPEDRARAEAALPGVTLVEGGATRSDSVRAGLAAVKTELVLIHDAARPGVPRAVIDRVLAALDAHDGAAPALPVTDALWRGDGVVEGVAERSGLWRAQTPQGFRTAAIRAAHAAHPGAAADDVEVARAAGIAVAIVAGDEAAMKITGPEDFARAERLFAGGGMDIRVGNGFDVHRFGPGDHVMLCGVAVPFGRGLQGHSDADVGLHTIADAIYGALAEGDIGTHFPPSDPQWKGAESHVFLRHAAGLARDRGFAIGNVDATLICEAPKIGPHAAAMRDCVAAIMGLEVGRVSVKATTTERLGFAGRGEGIACQATVTLVRP
ncbi:bifunctional 2-C-methyl-D-erythritol 4-phosphate cytidylyltransferase/2-C-methyl-D-erythritol 2,4-cyclodiphosphate synthase [Jannaschia ovalis]|uniref:Bifunctional enzyme IspD/IspF n=1 Tax=Jannaschia ovalis TaxID=3038773 RepID=A0ABY8LBF4_9RHOB|nr:bifunctional 2-C-methyl-D-erythritol 4-phosphate cytidylyltransferase/2-C-methyl-D-erythritol 2,4-cyclodiphosphate synthase [Jannaschia sp. GRR-S6-38]WGH78672.1 bifunctional 2-C-methyl-D-erythritol 4-phosphate cytidylyltransferase/2-C-methyl-D-erythritol 2,4-cyclodiphosphate synthase [Jannaschia sp. GRR-S6-38]